MYYVGLSVGNPYKQYVCQKCVGGITWPKHAHAQSQFWIRREKKKTENHEKQRQATLKRLKRGDDNELERNLRLEKVAASKMLAVETEVERRARLENDAATKRLRLAMEHGDGRRKKSKTGEDGSYCTAHVLAMIKGVVDVGVVLFLKPILKFGNYAYHSNLMFIGTHN